MRNWMYGSSAEAEEEVDRVGMPPVAVGILIVLLGWALTGIFLAVLS